LNSISASITIEVANSLYTDSYLLHGLIYHNSTTVNRTSLNIKVNNLTVSTSVFFVCPKNIISTFFYFKNFYPTTFNATNLSIYNLSNCDNLRVFHIISAINLTLHNSSISNSWLYSFLYFENVNLSICTISETKF